jgi:dolichyl-phosphate-mannose--protein O-mannosyl transferase
MQAISGLLLLFTITGFTYDITKRRSAALLAAFLYTIEPMALVESRVGLMNIFLALFSLLGLWFFWRWWSDKKHLISNFIFSVVFLTLAVGVKWIGIGALGAVIIFLLLQKFYLRNPIPLNKNNYFALLCIPLLYFVTFIPDILQGQDIATWHKQAINYHLTLTATHPYGSEWWSWPLMLRPIWLYYQLTKSGAVVGIIELGNWITWIGGIFALVYTLTCFYSNKNKPRKIDASLLFLTLTYLLLYLPWIFIGRVKFIYHYFIPVLILLILLAVFLDEKILSHPKLRWYGYGFLLLALGFFVYFLPLLIGYPISQSNYSHHMWLRSWI